MKNSLIILSIIASSAIIFFYNFSGPNQTDVKVQGQLTGNQLYKKYCSTCHQADGKGVRGMFPPLSGNEKVIGPSSEIIKIVLFGLEGPITVNERDYNQPMPPQKYLTDKQIADILTFVRSSWDNKASSVTPDEVLKARKLGKVKPN
jgi:nitrite reductase (NO-forming)